MRVLAGALVVAIVVGMMALPLLAQEGGGDTARVARPLAREIAARLLAEPPLKGSALAAARLALERAWDAIEAFEPRAARGTLAPWLANEALRHYRLPCSACGKGSVGVAAFEEGG